MNVDAASFVARGISARGPRGNVFENVHLRVSPGSLAVITGTGGTGRTSLLLALSGRMRVLTGYLEVSGYVLPDEAAAVRRLVVPARLRPGFELEQLHRVREVIAERRMTSKLRRESVDQALALVGLNLHPKALLCELHESERVLLAVALAVASAPAGVVVDDVDAGLPAGTRAHVWSMLRTVTTLGITVLASATDPPDSGDAEVIRLPYGRPDLDEPTEVHTLLDSFGPIGHEDSR